MKGRILSINGENNGKASITIEVDKYDINNFDGLNNCDIDFTVKKYRNKRSLDANSYAWVLISKIAASLSVDKNDIYRSAIRNIGGVSEIVCIQEKAAEHLKTGWEKNGLGWQVEFFPSKIKGCKNAILYYGSSTYDSNQMSLLIDHLIFEAKQLNIEILPPDKLEYMLKG